MKRMSTKGKMNKEMWQRVARGMDNVDLAVEHGKNLLNLSDDFSSCIANLENEIVASSSEKFGVFGRVYSRSIKHGW